jgi:hypothetical protein
MGDKQKYEIRISKSETNSKHEKGEYRGIRKFGFGILDFDFVSNFDIRFSNLEAKEWQPQRFRAMCSLQAAVFAWIC